MKKTFLFCLLVLSDISLAAHLPQSWISEGEGRKSSLLSSEDLSSTDAFLARVLGVQEKVLLQREEKKLNGFAFSQYVTEFSVSKSGLFGLSALKSNTAVELKWQKVKEQNLMETVPELEVLDDSPLALATTALELERLVMETGKVEASAPLRKNIQLMLQKIKYMMKQMEHQEFSGWKVAALRLDLSFSANGQVWTFAKAGAFARLRLDWKKIKKTSPPSNQSRKVGLVDKLLYDIDKVYADQALSGFKVKMINIGVGLSRKGQLGLASSKMGIVGFIRLVPLPNSKKSFSSIETDSQLGSADMEYVADEENRKSLPLRTISRRKWQSGLERSLRMANYFASRTQGLKGKWQVTEIKTIFELTQTGFLGLTSAAGTGALETEFVRK